MDLYSQTPELLLRTSLHQQVILTNVIQIMCNYKIQLHRT